MHPNDKGDEKMVGVWFPAIVRALESVGREGVKRGLGFEA